MNPSWQPRQLLPVALRVARLCTVVLAVFFVLVFLYLSVRRLHYPFDVEWIESTILVSVDRLVHHEALYAPPSLHYVPFLYAPLYFYLCAWVAKFTGVGFIALRLVSTASACGTLAVIFAYVYRETRDSVAAWAAVGVFASLNGFIGAWFDIGRVDSLFILLLMVSLYCTRFASPVLAALAWMLAFQTKQSAIGLAVPFLLLYWERGKLRRPVVALVSFALLAGGSVAFMNHVSDGWYSRYIFGVAAGLPAVMRLAVLYVPEVILMPLAVATVLLIAGALYAPPTFRTRVGRFYILGTVFFFFAFWEVHAHRGVGNSMQALYLWMALLLGVTVHRLVALCRERGGEGWESGTAGAAALLVLTAVCVQMLSQSYNPGAFLPPKTELEARQALIAQVRAIPGPVYIVNHAYDDVLAGKEPFADGEAVGGIVDAKQGKAFVAELHDAETQHRLGAIVLDDYYGWLSAESLQDYPVIVPAAGSDLPRFQTSQPKLIRLPCSSLTNGLAKKLLPEGEQPRVVPGACSGVAQ